jgi:hypothetical protein
MEGRRISAALAAAFCTMTYRLEAGNAPESYQVHLQMRSEVQIQAALLKDGQDAATRIFAGIHVRLAWGEPSSIKEVVETCGSDAVRQDIAVKIIPHAPASFSGAALAMATPYSHSGVRIVIFFDRVAPLLRGHHAPESAVLGYVLAHEIGHVLQGVARHSEIGVMRARWLENDFRQMGIGVLTFTNDDVRIIRSRLGAIEPAPSCIPNQCAATTVGASHGLDN